MQYQVQLETVIDQAKVVVGIRFAHGFPQQQDLMVCCSTCKAGEQPALQVAHAVWEVKCTSYLPQACHS
jgi:hypothetical protein